MNRRKFLQVLAAIGVAPVAAAVVRVNGRMSAAFFGEGASLTTSDLSFSNLTIVVDKEGVLTYIPNELAAKMEIADLIGDLIADNA